LGTISACPWPVVHLIIFEQCWISDPYLTAKVVTEYLFFWTAFVVSLLTFVAFAWLAVRLKGNLLWMGFPTRDEGLVRLGLIAIDGVEDPSPTRGLSISVNTDSYKIYIMFLVQYFNPQDAAAIVAFPAEYDNTELKRLILYVFVFYSKIIG
jgi:hypothetical protein